MTETATPPTVVVLGIPFHNVTFQETVQWARRRVESRQPAYIATVNMDFVMQAWRDPELQRILFEADLVVADGIPLVWLSGLTGPRLQQRVTGSDLVPLLAEMARDHDFSLFHLGGAPGVAEQAAATLVRRFPGLRVAGCYSPPYAGVLEMDHAGILAQLRAATPDLLLIAFGAPKQEKFAAMHVRHWDVPVSIGIGGSLDFLAGAQKRAPKLVQKMALEWLWRMLSDPPRLCRRYVGNLTFFAQALWQLLWIRCGVDRAQPPVPAAAELRRLAHVEPYRRLASPATAAAFVTALLEKAPAGPVVLDLSGVPWLSSVELGALLRLTMTLRHRQQPFRLANVGSRVQRLLDGWRLTDYLESGPSADDLQRQINDEATAPRHGDVRRTPEGHLLIQLPQELTEANVDAFRQRVAAATGAATDEWLIDAAATRFVDSSALRYFLELQALATAQGRTLRFRGIRPAVRQTFRLAKLESRLLAPESPPPQFGAS